MWNVSYFISVLYFLRKIKCTFVNIKILHDWNPNYVGPDKYFFVLKNIMNANKIKSILFLSKIPFTYKI